MGNDFFVHETEAPSVQIWPWLPIFGKVGVALAAPLLTPQASGNKDVNALLISSW